MKEKMKKFKLSPIMTFIILIFGTLLLSWILSLFNVQAEYSTVNTSTKELTNNVVQVENLLSLSGLKYIVTSAVSNFVNFTPLSMLIITLIGIGVMEWTGFTKTFFTIITQTFKKNTITFWLIFLSILSSILGDYVFVILLPIGALLFKYGHRNPLGGIIATFAGVSFGYGVNVFMSSIDSSLMSITLNAATILDAKYLINNFYGIFIMLAALIIMSIVMTRITEKMIMPKLGKYEFDEIETLDKVNLSNRELRGLIVGIAAGLIYILVIAYMIIPGLPLSGGLLDNGGEFYIDKLFGPNSLFNQGFIFIITMFFIVIGFFYGVFSKSIKNNKDVTDSLAFSLDGIGSILVLIFVASVFIGVFKKTNIGLVLTAGLSNLIGTSNFTGIGLILLLFGIAILSNLFLTSSPLKWAILSGITVPVFMNASLSPEFAQIIFSAGSSVTMGLTPLMAYFVIYIAFLEKYNKSETITLFGSLRYLAPYSVAVCIIWFILLIGWYITGIPLGIETLTGVMYVA
ncbi:MAG: AbgT family transporter [Bacilli bacterium]